MNKLSIFSMALLMATLALLRYALQAAQHLVRRHHAQRADFFRRHPVQAGDIVFLGDSLTAGGNWHEIFPGLPVKIAASTPIPPSRCRAGWMTCWPGSPELSFC